MKIRRLTKMHSLIALYLSSMAPSGQGLGREGVKTLLATDN